jgi:hypothetical protein
MNRLITITLFVCATCQLAHAEGFRLSVGVTTDSAENLEIAYSLKKWDVALGYVGSQVIPAKMKTDFCAEAFQLPPCERLVVDTTLELQPYYYASMQRILELRSERLIRPFVGLGVSLFSDTNPLVSSALGFSVSLGINFGERLTLQWRHFSNGGIDQPNLGQDILMAGWRL